MVDTPKIEIERVLKSRLDDVDFQNVPFGKIYADHMLMVDYVQGTWSNTRIVPYGYLAISPASPAIHYGQSIFEGMKAHRSPADEILLFRPIDHCSRLNRSAERMSLPTIPPDFFIETLRELLALERRWVPSTPGASLYIRPFIFSADEYIGIRPSVAFTYMVILSPVGPYYTRPLRVKVETHYSRSAQGGTGYAKAGGNYGGAIYPTRLAQENGFDQLIWTDSKSHKYIEESGTMNVMFVINGTLITPALGDTILAGITRDSILKLARQLGIPVEERKISVKEITDAFKAGELTEVFGTGTAATIAPIESVAIGHDVFDLPATSNSKISTHLFESMQAIKYGRQPGPAGWIIKV
jgi:branched-chain amino acid aminotransferase